MTPAPAPPSDSTGVPIVPIIGAVAAVVGVAIIAAAVVMVHRSRQRPPADAAVLYGAAGAAGAASVYSSGRMTDVELCSQGSMQPPFAGAGAPAGQYMPPRI